jgi:hypothetical protein
MRQPWPGDRSLTERNPSGDGGRPDWARRGGGCGRAGTAVATETELERRPGRPSGGETRAAAVGRPRAAERAGWYVYDWANSAFSTTVVTVFLGPYLTSVTRAAADADGFVHHSDGDPHRALLLVPVSRRLPRATRASARPRRRRRTAAAAG